MGLIRLKLLEQILIGGGGHEDFEEGRSQYQGESVDEASYRCKIQVISSYCSCLVLRAADNMLL